MQHHDIWTTARKQIHINMVERFLVLSVAPSLKKYKSYTNAFDKIHFCSVKRVDLLRKCIDVPLFVSSEP